MIWAPQFPIVVVFHSYLTCAGLHAPFPLVTMLHSFCHAILVTLFYVLAEGLSPITYTGLSPTQANSRCLTSEGECLASHFLLCF
jgi:hypothetical protein